MDSILYLGFSVTALNEEVEAVAITTLPPSVGSNEGHRCAPVTEEEILQSRNSKVCLGTEVPNLWDLPTCDS